MLSRTDGKVHIVLRKQFQCLLHGGGLIQQETNGGGSRQIRLFGILIHGLPMAHHQVSHAQPLFVHAVQRDVDCRQGNKFLPKASVGFPVLAKAQKIQTAGRNGFVALLGLYVDNGGAAGRPVIVSSKGDRTVVLPDTHR